MGVRFAPCLPETKQDEPDEDVRYITQGREVHEKRPNQKKQYDREEKIREPGVRNFGGNAFDRYAHGSFSL